MNLNILRLVLKLIVMSINLPVINRLKPMKTETGLKTAKNRGLRSFCGPVRSFDFWVVRTQWIVVYQFLIAIISHSVLQEFAVEWVASGLLLELEQFLIGLTFPERLSRRLSFSRRLGLGHRLDLSRHLGRCEQWASEDGDDCGERTYYQGKLWKEWLCFEERLKSLFDDFEQEKWGPFI